MPKKSKNDKETSSLSLGKYTKNFECLKKVKKEL